MIKKLEWDSSFFNIPIYDLQSIDASNKDLLRALSKIKEGVVQCKLDIKKYKLLEMLIQNNFKIEDFGITYNKIPNNLSNLKLDFAIEEDKEIIQNIASGRFDHTRFKDFYFGEKSAESLYNYWICAAIRKNYDDCCLVKKDKNGCIIGFVTVKKVENCLKVGLIAVDINHERKGIGKDLMRAAEAYALQHNIKRIIVTTQYNNLSARNMFKSMKYSVSSVFFWLYFKVD
jgi:GNAT superfamily N-acetyltransferase